MRQQTLAVRRQSDRQQSRQYCFLLSGFTDHEKSTLAEQITRLGGKYLDSKTFVPDCTHVVSARPMRSEKYLCGCAAGNWIVASDFVTASEEAGHWVEEEDYLWGNINNKLSPSSEYSRSMASAPKRWHDHVKSTNRGAFSGWTVAILVMNKNNRPAVYKRLIECGGGTVISLRMPIKEPDHLANLLTYIFVDKCFEDKVRPLRDKGVPCLAPDFIAEFLFEQPPNQEKYNIATYEPDTKKKDSLQNSTSRGTVGSTKSSQLQGCHRQLSQPTLKTAFLKTSRQGKDQRSQNLLLSQSSSSLESLVFTQSSQSSQSQSSQTASPTSVSNPRRTLTQSPLTRSSLTPGALRPSEYTPGSVLIEDLNVKRQLKFSSSQVQKTVADVKKKHAPGYYTRVPYWMQVQPPKYQDDHMTAMPFPSMVSNLIEAYLEEDFWLRAVQSTHSYLTARRYPSPSLMHIFMSKILESTDAALKNQSIHLLKSVLCLHRPSTPEMSAVYLRSFVPPENGSFGLESDDPIDTPWDFIGSVIRKSIQRPPRETDSKDADPSDAQSTALRHSSELVLGYIVALLEQDFQAYTYREDNPGLRKRKTHHCMLSTILWPNHRIKASAAVVRQLITFLLQAVTLVEEMPNMYECLRMIITLVEIAAECCRISAGESSILGNLESGVHQDLATEIASMAVQDGLTDRSESLNVLLSLLRPNWLKLRVVESLLSAYDDNLVWNEHRHMASEPLSLKKVVNYFFYLIPPTSKSNPVEGTPETKEQVTPSRKRSCQDAGSAAPLKTLVTSNSISKSQNLSGQMNKRATKMDSKVNRRNMKGETPLHVACIKNDVAKVRELLSCPAIQVNLTDYAGWTALHEAANHGHVDCVKELLKYKPRQKITSYFMTDKTKKCQDNLDLVAAPSECGTTPLHDAVNNGHVEVARLLVQAGGKAVLMARNKEGLTALELASDDAMERALELRDKDSDKNILNDNHNKENMFTNSDSRKRLQSQPGTPSKRLCISLQNACPTEDAYTHVLGSGQDPEKFVTVERCEQFCLLVCHLLQACLNTHKLVAIKAGLDDNHQTSTPGGTDDTSGGAVQYKLMPTPPCNPCGPDALLRESQSLSDAGSRLLDDLTEMSRLESHIEGFVHHLGRIGPWVGSQRSKVCNKVIYEMKVLVQTCL